MHNAFSYEGKRALVVGCSSGMGAATAAIVRSLGGEVHGVDYKAPDADLASFTECDLRDEAQIDAMLASVGSGWDAVFYCAGLPQTHPPLDVMKVNFVAMRKVVDGLLAGMGAGSAVAIISSNAGLQFMNHMAEITELIDTADFDAAMAWCGERPELINEGYTFSKEAIIVFTMRRAIEVVGRGIRVNCISPGPTSTPMMPDFEAAAGKAVIDAFLGPMERRAQPEEMGWPLAFLNSDGASFITGLNLLVDAGFVAGTMTGLIDLEALFAKAMADVQSAGDAGG
jgi:NAD(P)-dependent dehydrogenase (short-subunit alcohol dehydrogenase family)